jgi:hypothetical protein
MTECARIDADRPFAPEPVNVRLSHMAIAAEIATLVGMGLSSWTPAFFARSCRRDTAEIGTRAWSGGCHRLGALRSSCAADRLVVPRGLHRWLRLPGMATALVAARTAGQPHHKDAERLPPQSKVPPDALREALPRPSRAGEAPLESACRRRADQTGHMR